MTSQIQVNLIEWWLLFIPINLFVLDICFLTWLSYSETIFILSGLNLVSVWYQGSIYFRIYFSTTEAKLLTIPPDALKMMRFFHLHWWEEKLFSDLSAATAAAKSLQSCPTLCDPIHGSPPGSHVPGILQARTLEWVAISFSNAWKWKVKVKLLSHCLPLSNPMDCSLPGSSIHGIFQARVLEWGAIAFLLLH